MSGIDVEKIHHELKASPGWILWKHETRSGKKTKVPYQVNGSRAKTDDPKTWTSFEEVLIAYEAGGYSGLGYVFNARDPFCGVDIDHCRDPKTGMIEPWAEVIIKQFNSYTEISPSETGVHILAKGKLPAGGRKKGNVEIYDSGRFFTMTGNALDHRGGIRPAQQAINNLLITHLKKEVSTCTERLCSSPGLSLSDSELIQKAIQSKNGDNFHRLYQGQWKEAAYRSQSEADQAFCNLLAFWTGRDPVRIDSIFRQSGLMRQKWDVKHHGDGRTYGQGTIEKALANCSEIYSGKQGNGMALSKDGQKVDIGDKVDKGDYHLTELGNAERFAGKYRGQVAFVTAWGKWMFYDGTRWTTKGAESQVRHLSHKVAKSFYHLAAEAVDKNATDRLAKWAATSSRSSAITAMLKEASAMLAIEPERLDTNPWLFNCENCTINLKTGSLQPHDRNDFITKITPVFFNPEATAPTFLKVLQTCLAEDVIEFVQRFFGYCMAGTTKEQCLSIWYGTGQNSKSTVLNAVQAAFGEYAQTTRPETFMVRYNNTNTSDLAKLRGARLVTAAEGEDGQRLAESSVKQMTGGEQIQARALYQDFFEFTPEFKIILCTNHKPIIRGTDYAIWRRIRLIPFTVTIPLDQQDKDLAEKLKAELPGILTWVVAGAAKWLQNGLGTSEKIQAATHDYQSEQNIIQNFFDANCVEMPDATVGATDLFRNFDQWRKDEGHRKVTQTKFGNMLGDLGFHKDRNTIGRKVYFGIGLISGANDTFSGPNCSDYSAKTPNCSERIIQ
ncbi:MAG: hypothetical protein AVO38_08295 [delta proteobacterium ML8_D]|nr:MAG: hypothetical protein AVO38_08295 [delta proteobacterium ML8_D]